MMASQLDGNSAPLIVCERTGDWAMHLRRALAQHKVPLREVRSLLECDEQLLESPESCLFLALDVGRQADVVDFVAAWSDRFPRCRIVIGAPRDQAGYEPLFREAGAVHFVTSPRDLAATATIIERHLARALAANEA